MKKAVVCGAGGFIGGHLVKKLKDEGYWVRGVDIKEHEFCESAADEFVLLDLREPENCRKAVMAESGPMDEVYQLAADMGGMGFIHSEECAIMHNNVLINVHMTDAAAKAGVKRYFYSSSVCIYRDMAPDEPPISEDDAIPANPDNEYGWEKLYSERVGMTYGRHSDMAVRIARFQNCYGPEGTWRGGREKAPAAMCRKVAEADEGGEVEVWGDGTAIRSYTYVDDLVDGIYRLTQSNIDKPTNIGSEDRISVKELVETVIGISGKKLGIKYVEGPVGVRSRNFKKDRIKSIGWEAKVSFREGIARTFHWVSEEVGLGT